MTATGTFPYQSNEHRRPRFALNVGFTAAAVRNYQPVFRKAAETVADELEKSSGTTTDICPLLSSVALDSDLGDEFAATNIEIVELSATQSEAQILADAIGPQLPTWLWRAAVHLPTKAFDVIRREQYLAKQIEGRIVQEKMEATRQGLEINNDLFSLLGEIRFVRPEFGGHHLAVSPDTPKTLSEDDLVDQTAIILIAGQESTANSLAFGLLELARQPDLQDKLRGEINSFSGPMPETCLRQYAAARCIHQVTSHSHNLSTEEILRFYPVVPITDRIAVQDTVIPLGESITTSTGERIHQIPVQKGQVVTVAISSYQRLASHWGKDPHKFDPSRWLDGATYQGEAVGPYANLWRFA
ncbi:cytochrome P450 [Mycena leptocephala]|nr:cytochrome P450 [Mycena leptocephala]